MSEGKFSRLVEIMQTLRSEKGCPWDKEQTRETLKSFIIEEAYELIEAIDSADPERIKEELGDLLFQIIFQAQIARENGEFTIEDVVEGIAEKMIARHPHVFGEVRLDTPEEVLKNWDRHKRKEGKLKDSLMEGIPEALPSLLKALRVQERAARVGFDWSSEKEVIQKIQEEIEELKEMLLCSSEPDREKLMEELGDILFSVVNLCRRLRINPEDALRRTVKKFISRFQFIEAQARERGVDLSGMALEEMDRLWEEAKAIERKSTDRS